MLAANGATFSHKLIEIIEELMKPKYLYILCYSEALVEKIPYEV